MNRGMNERTIKRFDHEHERIVMLPDFLLRSTVLALLASACAPPPVPPGPPILLGVEIGPPREPEPDPEPIQPFPFAQVWSSKPGLGLVDEFGNVQSIPR